MGLTGNIGGILTSESAFIPYDSKSMNVFTIIPLVSLNLLPCRCQVLTPSSSNSAIRQSPSVCVDMFGSLLSIYGCYQYHKITSRSRDTHEGVDAERGVFVPPSNGESRNIPEFSECLLPQEEHEAAGFISYLFQVIFQVNAGAVMLTDTVYWFILFPFLTVRNYDLNFTTVVMHTINALFLLGGKIRFPWFRFSYFVLYTGAFVIFQWILHAFVSIWWPYPFMDLSSPSAPLWYIFIGLIHVPCYGIFALFVKLKHYMLSKWFPQSYQL